MAQLMVFSAAFLIPQVQVAVIDLTSYCGVPELVGLKVFTGRNDKSFLWVLKVLTSVCYSLCERHSSTVDMCLTLFLYTL